MTTQQLETLIQRLEKVTTRLESIQSVGGGSKGGSASGSSGAKAEEVAPQVSAYDEYTAGYLEPFIAVCKDIGGDLAGLGDLVQKGFDELKGVIAVASKSKKPSDTEFAEVIKPVADVLSKISDYKNQKRGSDFYNHALAVDEGIKCLAWVTVPNTPVAYTKEMVNAAQFYNQKVLVAYRTKDKRHVEFVEKFKLVIEELANYIKEHHTTGLKWNPQGGSWKEAGKSTTSTAKAPSSAPSSGGPPPPPPGPPPKLEEEAPKGGGGGGATADLFASINAKRDNAGSGLRKVKAEEKTKNRPQEERVAVVPATIEKKTTVAVKGGGAKKAPSGPPKFELLQGMGEKWIVENFEGKHDILITETKTKQAVYIYNCKDVLVTVQGKVNNVVLDSCTKTGVILDDAVSSVETVNSQSVKLQVNGKVPTINIDKTDGVQIFLSKDCITANIVTSKSSEMNVCVPEGDDYTEVPIPEQFQSVWDVQAKKLVTEMVSLNL